VLIDGRSVYSPLFSGVYFAAQEVMLDDVARIEVISGPGATFWGANAMNGVINIITRTAAETQGALAAAGCGNLQRNASVRYEQISRNFIAAARIEWPCGERPTRRRPFVRCVTLSLLPGRQTRN